MAEAYSIDVVKKELLKHLECDDYDFFYLYTFEELRTLNMLKKNYLRKCALIFIFIIMLKN